MIVRGGTFRPVPDGAGANSEGCASQDCIVVTTASSVEPGQAGTSNGSVVASLVGGIDFGHTWNEGAVRNLDLYQVVDTTRARKIGEINVELVRDRCQPLPDPGGWGRRSSCSATVKRTYVHQSDSRSRYRGTGNRVVDHAVGIDRHVEPEEIAALLNVDFIDALLAVGEVRSEYHTAARS